AAADGRRVHGRTLGTPGGKRLVMDPAVAPRHQVRVRAELRVDPGPEFVLHARGGQVGNIEGGERTGESNRLGLALALVVAEKMQFVLSDGTAERGADLLVRVLQDAVRHKICGLEAIVAEVPRKRPGVRVRAGFGDGIDLETASAPLRGVESI